MVDVLLGLNAVAPMEFWDPVENMEDHGDIKGIHWDLCGIYVHNIYIYIYTYICIQMCIYRDMYVYSNFMANTHTSRFPGYDIGFLPCPLRNRRCPRSTSSRT